MELDLCLGLVLGVGSCCLVNGFELGLEGLLMVIDDGFVRGVGNGLLLGFADGSELGLEEAVLLWHC